MKYKRKNNLELALGLAVFISSTFAFVGVIRASTNISDTYPYFYAWNDLIGWIQFNTTENDMDVNVLPSHLTGSASSSSGEISLDCETSSGGDICATSNYKVINDGMGNLSGYAWNDDYGWISFCGGQETDDCPGEIVYRVTVDPDTGVFTDGGYERNYAWSDVAGWISFNCDNHEGGGCDTYKVASTWVATSTSGYLDSSTFDTGASEGAQINSVYWKGDLPNETEVGFQFAGSNSSSGPWSFVGPSGTGLDYYEVVPDTSIKLDYSLHNNQRYFRYRATLFSNRAQTETPRIDEIVINWSP